MKKLTYAEDFLLRLGIIMDVSTGSPDQLGRGRAGRSLIREVKAGSLGSVRQCGPGGK
jgi:hypothetical protein